MNWKDFFDRLGMDGTRWQWRIMRWQQRMAERGAERAAPENRAASRYKFCETCGAILPREEKVCPRCQAPAPGWRSQYIKRRLALVLPGWVPVTGVLLAANGLVMLAAMLFFGLGALFQPGSRMLVAMGALVPALFQEGEGWRLITYGYLHIGLMHIAFNMIALSQVGPVLEEQVGRARFFVVYTLAVIGGGLADILFRDPISIVAGASGALFGLIGFGMSYAHFYGGFAGRMQRDFFLRWAVYGFVFGLLVGADNIAHAGGLVTGALLGFLVERERVRGERFDPLWNALAGLCAAATVGAFVWMAVAGVGAAG
ncbi:MAG TPA: rhomboid family intramembrane serine protease [Kiritimatiellia bacterium]|nr:rhomboid family intramembrane serine protease [Kiritimatiellia bacterium]HSA18519.1 rhomboid family intramembrane serine protease [Kiritimatiellia bacterium]